MDHGALGQRGDGKQRVAADGPGNDGAVADIEPVMDVIAACSGEDLAFVVDHAACGILAHAAAAERMRRRGRHAHAGRGKRVLDVAPADRLGHLGQSLVDAPVDGLLTDFRPSDFEATVFEDEPAARVVVRNDEECAQARERTFVDALDEALCGAENSPAGDEEHR